jgi:hypothetical protein
LVLKSHHRPYVNAGIFLAYIRTILLPYIDSLRRLAVFTKEVAALLMDDCSADVSDAATRVLTEARVRVITFAPHITQVFQVLVLTLFRVPMGCPRYERPFDGANATVKVIMKVYQDFLQTMARSNVWGIFRAFGFEFEFDTRREPCGLLFDEVELRQSAAFQEL